MGDNSMDGQGRTLMELLKAYGQTDVYPFHMPGHKRRLWAEDWGNPVAMDITEIDGFDNLHAPEGLLKESMDRAAAFYGTDESFYLVNGSTCGILSSICACTRTGERILMARNCHKAAYHGVFLNRLQVAYLYPQWIDEFGMDGGLLLKSVQEGVEKHPDIRAVLLVSPTYEGVVSDIGAISAYLHKKRIVLIVDEAHGAHFPFGVQGRFPASALSMGADLVIQSLHKTLPSPTQTAILHVKGTLVDRERLRRYMHIFQTSSPSYLLLAGIDRCLQGMMGQGRQLMEAYTDSLLELRERVGTLSHIQLAGRELSGVNGVFDYDISKLVLSVMKSNWTGRQLMEELRSRYRLELEMSAPTYALAMTTVGDTREGLERLWKALEEIDKALSWKKRDLSFCQRKIRLEQACSMAEAMDGEKEGVDWQNSEGRVAAETIFVYPPGIPIMVPGEVISKPAVEAIKVYFDCGYPVLGMKDESSREVQCLKEKIS